MSTISRTKFVLGAQLPLVRELVLALLAWVGVRVILIEVEEDLR